MSVLEETAENEHEIPPWATGSHLRKIEESVIIPNLMKKKAKIICKEYLDAFAACCHGRTISLAWSCGKETDEMRDCLEKQLAKPELFEESKEEYLSKREKFQKLHSETGQIKMLDRKYSAF